MSEKILAENPADELGKLEEELRKANEKIAEFTVEGLNGMGKLKSAVSFDKDFCFSDEILKAAAYAKIFVGKNYSDFKAGIQNQIAAKKTEKFIREWESCVKVKADELKTRHTELMTLRNQLSAQITSIKFTAQHEELKNLVIPNGYSVSENGIEKIVGEKSKLVSRCPVVIKTKLKTTDEKTLKYVLSYLSGNDSRWQDLPTIGAEIIFNSRKLIDLAAYGLPVTSSNANLLVDYLDAFMARNKNILPICLQVPRCGWYKTKDLFEIPTNFKNPEIFVDPRLNRKITLNYGEYGENSKEVEIVVDDSNSLSQNLKSVGSIDEWKKAYEIAKKSHIARLVVAASIAPPLLKILDGERNFILYIYGTTRAGKSTALLLGASAVGNEDLVISFDGTNNGLLGMAAETCDYPLFIDEKQSADKNLKEQFQRFIYSVGNGKGRSRANKDGSARPVRKWRNITICNGETELLDDNATGGAYTRLLQVRVPNEILPADDCREIRKILKDNYGIVFPLIVDQILKEETELKKCFDGRSRAFHSRYPNVLPEYCRYAALLSIADALLNKILGDVHTEAFRLSYNTATDFIGLFVPTIDEISDARREKNFVESFVAQNQAHFEDSRSIKINGVTEYLSPTPPYFGKFADDGFIYIIDSVLQKACKDAGFDYKKVSADLIADGFFIPADKIEKDRKKPRDTVRFRIGASRPYCYRFKQEEEQQTDD